MKGTWRRSALLLLLLGAVPLFAVDVELPVAGRGVLAFDLADGWREESRDLPENLPPTVTWERSGSVRGAFLLTAIWSPSGEASFGGEEFARGVVLRTRDKLLPSASESELLLSPIQGAQGNGFFFAATDRNYKPGPGQYRVVTSGALAAGDLLLVFTVLSDGKNDPAVQEALAAVSRASLKK